MDSFETLFSRNMDEVLQKIFLNLNPSSLHSARQTCRRWNMFILSRVWGSRMGRRVLEEKLTTAWMSNKEEEVEHDVWDDMFIEKDSFVLLDGERMVVGLSHVGEGGAMVVCKWSGRTLHHLDHKFDHKVRKRPVSKVVVTDSIIVTLCGDFVFVWDKEAFTLLDRVNVMERNGASHFHAFIKDYVTTDIYNGHVSMEAAGSLIAVDMSGENNGKWNIQVWKLESGRLHFLKMLASCEVGAGNIGGRLVADSKRVGVMRAWNKWTFFDAENLQEKENLEMFEGHEEKQKLQITWKSQCLQYPYFASILPENPNPDLFIWDIEKSFLVCHLALECWSDKDLLCHAPQPIIRNKILYMIQNTGEEQHVTLCRLEEILETPANLRSVLLTNSNLKTRKIKLQNSPGICQVFPKWLIDKTSLVTV